MGCEEQYLQYIDEHEPEMLSLWKELVEIESPSHHKPGVDAVGERIARFCTETLGYHVRYQRDEVYGDCLCACSCPFEEYRDGIVLSAHMDTVHAIGSFEPLFSRDEEFFYGPGVGDCKGGVVLALFTAATLKYIGYVGRPIKLLFAADEESGGPTGPRFFPPELEGSAYMLNAESGKRGQIVVGRKSSIIAVYTIRGVSAHIGYLKGKPQSAIREAASKLLELENRSDYDLLTFCCGTITGGIGPTSVPDCCRMEVNVRIKDESVIQKAIDILYSVAALQFVEGTTTELEIKGNRVPMSDTPENRWLCEEFSKASQALGFGPYEPIFVGGGSDAPYASEKHIPVICATGPVTDFQHTRKERAVYSSLAERTKVHTKLILDSLQK